MRTSKYLLATLKETPAATEIISHKLMLRAGLIRQLGSGLYTWLPLGQRVLQKIINIVRNEMDNSGALEIFMPALQPAELWQKSQRWDKYGSLLLKIIDRHGRNFCYGPTHEEVITDLIKNELNSYKQLPINFYQIQSKFRDEIRPRFGVMRAREFLMKDAYSFHANADSLNETYQLMFATYQRIFTRLGLKFRAVAADSGEIGGKLSHEFQVLAASGEDTIAYSDKSEYAANIELATTISIPSSKIPNGKPMQLVDTANKTSINEICQLLKIKPQQTIKTLIVKGAKSPLVALLLRGDHQLNTIKASKIAEIATPLTFASKEEIIKFGDYQPGTIGPINLNMPIIADNCALQCIDFACGANQKDKHYINVNWNRDCPTPIAADLRNVVAGDPSPDGQGHLQLTRGIEVGHIFQLGDKYSQALQANVLNHDGKNINLQMGCYGIGISRIVAATIEQHHDENGIIWPDTIAPFQIALVPIQLHKDEKLRNYTLQLYQQLQDNAYSVLLDDSNERPGVIFAKIDLIGIPHRLVLSKRGLEQGTIEYKARHESQTQEIKLNELFSLLEKKIAS